MNANNTTDTARVYRFIPVKFNKHDTIYQGLENNPKDSFITELVKVEKFQGYSNAHNLGLYFRIKNQSSWAKSKQITGLWKTTRIEAFYGDIRENTTKTLLVFIIDPVSHVLTVYEYPRGYYPHRNVIDQIITAL
jgi:hypothetical protein